ncbi:MAG: hypothetical protein RIB86_11620, partial [Imperialibacter sp.]
IFLKVESGSDSSLNGISISAVNAVQGTQNGLSIGIVNTTHRLRGMQIGIINIVKDNPKGLRVLPIINAHFGGGKGDRIDQDQ